MSSLIFVDLAMILLDFGAWFSEKGFVPEAVAQQYQSAAPAAGNFFGIRFYFPFLVPRIDLLSGVTDDRITLAFYLAVMLGALLSAFGLWTRISSIVMAVGIVTLHHRNGLILHGGDTVMRISALYIAIAPSGKACSLDRLIGLWRGRIAPGPVRLSVWAQRLLAYNTALIYFTTFWLKFGFGTHWRDLTAAWYPARLHEFDRFPVPDFFKQLPFVYVSTFLTLAIELALGTLVFYRPLRRWVLLAGVLLHVYIDYSMNIPLFSLLMVAMYLSFYDGEEIDAWARRVGLRLARYRVIVFPPKGMWPRDGAMAGADAADPLDLVRFQPGDAPAWTAECRERKVDPFRASLVRSLGAWPVGLVPTLWRRMLNRSLQTEAFTPRAPLTETDKIGS